MVEPMKKSESEDESEIRTDVLVLQMEIRELKRILEWAVEEIRTMQKGDNWGGKHQNDGGWFD